MDFTFKNLTEKESIEKGDTAKEFLENLYKGQRFVLLINDNENLGTLRITQSEHDMYLGNMVFNYLLSGWQKAIENGASRQSCVKEASNIFDKIIKQLTIGE